MKKNHHPSDPRGLIFEAYRIRGIGEPECRSIFLDWALGLGMDADPVAHIAALLACYEGDNPDHPMTRVLTEGLTQPARKGRRGGRRQRFSTST